MQERDALEVERDSLAQKLEASEKAFPDYCVRLQRHVNAATMNKAVEDCEKALAAVDAGTVPAAEAAIEAVKKLLKVSVIGVRCCKGIT